MAAKKTNDFVNQFARYLAEIPRPMKRLIMVAADSVAIPMALWAAISLRNGAAAIPFPGWEIFALALGVSIPVFAACGLYRAVVRFLGHRAVFAVAIAIVVSALAIGVLQQAAQWPSLSWSVVAIYSCMAWLYVSGSRFLVRYYLLTRQSQAPIARVAIYGAGVAGAQLSASLLSTRAFDPVLFIDDSRALHGSIVNGLRVYGPQRMPSLVRKFGIQRILLALPSQSRRRRREILVELEPIGVHVQTVPDIEQLVAGDANVDDLREVDVGDLLGRDAVPPQAALFDACIRGKIVMVTGAGGSIGSELCRQIIRSGPVRLLLFEMCELALYDVERELRGQIEQQQLQVELVALVGNAQHKHRLRDILASYRVQTVYHAAAYKHVPIVEQNVVEGIRNNVMATWHAAEAALEADVEAFVLISTDKAVNPTNVMGATKRFAEIVLQGLSQRPSKTRFCMVRFGNVLASSGSVVPLFYEQIRAGGPITVTHPDVIRYFMTIPEAAQLVIQAGAMAKGGDVFVLDMGKPVRIDDLARRMVHLMGLAVRDLDHPDGDIEIAYTGLRPAEKLFEELLIGNNVTGTEHPMILRAIEHSLPWERVQELLGELHLAMRRFDCQCALELLREAVIEYRPAEQMHDLVWARQQAAAQMVDIGKVTDLQSRRLRGVPPDVARH